MHVRSIQSRDDVQGVINVHGRAWRAAYDHILPSDVLEQQSVDPTTEEVETWYDRLRENPEGVLVATVEDEVRGFADIRWGDVETKPFVDAREAGLRAIYVHPEHWGDGIGTTLLEAGLDRLPSSVHALVVEVFAANEIGRSFYETNGFRHAEDGSIEIGGREYPTAIYVRDVR